MRAPDIEDATRRLSGGARRCLAATNASAGTLVGSMTTRQVAVPLVAAVIGGAITAAAMLGRRRPARPRVTRQRAARAPRARVDGPDHAARSTIARPPSVVYIRARTVAAGRGRVRGHDAASDLALSTGSGFVLDGDGRAADERARRSTASPTCRSRSPTARRVAAHVVGKDEQTDLAVLAVDPDGLDLHPLELGDSDAVRAGDPVVAIGNPNGIEAGRRDGPHRGGRPAGRGARRLHDQRRVRRPTR